MILIPQYLYERIKSYALRDKSEEVCGIIGGVIIGGNKYIKEIYFLENTDHSAAHFSINPKEQLKAVRDMRTKGIVPLGCFHSHPAAGAYPSDEDKRLAYDKTASYMIISLANEATPVLRSFQINNKCIEEKISII